MIRSPMKRTEFKPPEPKPDQGPRQNRCGWCKTKFVADPPWLKHCSSDCGAELGMALTAKQKAKAQRAERAETKKKLKKRSDYQREAQTAINAWVRLVRDRDLPCISCGHDDHGQKFDCGHYITRGSRPNLALEPRNLAKQCHWCNVHLSGNQILYRMGLVARIGLSEVEALEADTTPRKYSNEQLTAIKDHYNKLVRAIK